MIAQKENRRQLINFLVRRWRSITDFAALERVFIAHYQYAKDNDLPIPQIPSIIIPQACRQIEIIKQHIIEILPEARFIGYDFIAQAPLSPNDFVEIYIADHHQCILKVEETMKRLLIT